MRLYRKIVFFLISLIATAVALHGGSFERELEQVEALGNLTKAPGFQLAGGYPEQDSIKAIYFDALPYRGKPTRVFALLGLPEDREGPVPGIVLVHGGGGSAFREWVEKWNDAGFAAISIAVEGQTDVQDAQHEGPDNPKGWAPHEWAGPGRRGIYGDSSEPLGDQWMYHAVADTILANSLLRSLPEVDADKVGVMGISWGGVITSTVIGIDNRFAFAIPTYGCGHLSDAGNQYGRALGDNELYRQVWDPMVRMHRATMPALWLSWPGDQHFPLDCQAECYRAMPGDAMVSLIPGMKHSHPAGWNPPDSFAFARSVVETGRPWCMQVSVRSENSKIEVRFDSTRRLDNAILVSTTGSGATGGREWRESAAALRESGNAWVVDASLPMGTTAWFVNVSSGGLTASSWYQEVDTIAMENGGRERWLFLGDSITMAGHYVDYIESWMLLHEGNAPEVIDLGLGSETVSCLSEPDHPFPRPCVHTRLHDVLHRVQPDRVFACYGMNCAIYHPFSGERFAAYRDGIGKLVDACQDIGAEVVLITPPPFASRVQPKEPSAAGEPYGYKSPAADYNDVLQTYADWILSLDGHDGIQAINIRTAIEAYMEKCYPKEPVHPNEYGHELIGEAILRGLGFETGSDLLETGINPWAEEPQWNGLMQRIRKQRTSYDQVLLNDIGHGNPNVMQRTLISFERAEEELKSINEEIEGFLSQ